MPSGQTSTLANRLPVYVDDATRLSSVQLSGSGPGTTAPTLSNVIPQIVLPGGVATTLTASQSGAVCFWDAAAGFTYTLPAPVVGLRFTFLVSVTATSSNHKLITDAGTTFLKGSVLQAVEDTTPGANPGPKDFLFNGSTHVACTMNGTTTGGLFGTRIEVIAISSTVWAITGYVKASGTIATPAATS